MAKHFTHIGQLSPIEGMGLLLRAKSMKEERFHSQLLSGKSIVLLFEKASTRTRVSFEVAVHNLGGQTIFLTPSDCQLGRSEPLKDTARVLSRYNDALIVRTFGQEKLDELMAYGSIPVINALTDEGHPCQVMSDLLTIFERTPSFLDLKIAWIGDGNNMANSWIEAAMIFPFSLHLACPGGFEPAQDLVRSARDAGAKIVITADPELAVRHAQYVNTDVWASMGQETEQVRRQKIFKDYCVDERLMASAAPDAKFMHCLPAHRGEEVSEGVFEGSQSIVFDQAENRLHMQKAILEWVFT